MVCTILVLCKGYSQVISINEHTSRYTDWVGRIGGGTSQVHIYFITEVFQAQVWSNEGTKILQQNPLSTLVVHTFYEY